jgi:hypothetical protein
MLTFDATSREFCVSRRIRTNTPLQAFVTLNDPVFFKATRTLAEKMYKTSDSVEEQIKFGFQQALYRSPTDQELITLTSLFRRTVELYREQPDELKALTSNADYATPELAATINLAAVILNLDEVITKG